MNPLILIAEDDADIRGLLKLYLEGEGFRVLEADNGARALDLARAQAPDMAILDIMMPQLNGFELTRALRKFSDIPILILSAKSQDNDKILGLNLGADDYITKPFNPVEIVARVKAQLRRASRSGTRTKCSGKTNQNNPHELQRIAKFQTDLRVICHGHKCHIQHDFGIEPAGTYRIITQH